MVNLSLKPWFKPAVMILFLVLFGIGEVYAAGSLPFNRTIDTFKHHFMAWIVVALVILWVATCLMLAFGEWGEGIKRILNILFWASLALAGPTGISVLFPGSGMF